MVISYINGKGGVGKSTLCFLTALGLREAGKGVRVEDLDPQRSVSAWLDGIQVAAEDARADCVLIDTRPAIDDPSVHAAIGRSDRVIIPCSPSPGDIASARSTIEVIRKFLPSGARAFVVLNMARQGTIFTKEARDALTLLQLPVMTTEIPDRQCIQRAILMGWGALDPDSQSAFFKLAIETIS